MKASNAQAKQDEGKRVNGVDISALHGTIKAVRENPKLGDSRFRLKNRWVGQALNESTIGEFFCAGEEHSHKKEMKYQNDEGYVLLGNDDAANPVEYVLHALAGCITTTTVYHAAAHGIPIEALETTLEGDLDLQGLLQTDVSVPSGYQNIKVSMQIKSSAAPEKLEQLKEFYKYSPVFDTITRAVNTNVQVRISD